MKQLNVKKQPYITQSSNALEKTKVTEQNVHGQNVHHFQVPD